MYYLRLIIVSALLTLPLSSAGVSALKPDYRVRMIFTGSNEFALRTFNLLYNAGVRCPDSLSMFLASAITETGWGTSRKCREDNNLFGVVGRVYVSREAAIKHRLNFKNGWDKVGPDKAYKVYIQKFAKRLKPLIRYELARL